MRAVRYHEYGGSEVLRIEEVETPTPDPDEVLVRVEAIGVNPREVYSREGNPNDPRDGVTGYEPPALPMIPGLDVAGVVEAVGDDVETFEPGDRVAGTGLGIVHQGTYAEFVTVPIDRVETLPPDVGFREGAAVGTAGSIAWHALVNNASLTPGDSVLIHGGSGGVGHFAVQIANAAGTNVVATAGSEERCEQVRSLGAAHVFQYGRDDLLEAVQSVAPDGVDSILTTVPNAYYDFNVHAAAAGGTIVYIDGFETRFSTIHQARSKNLTFEFTSVSTAPDRRAVLRRLFGLIAQGDLRVEIARTYGLEGAGDAQRDVMDGDFVGKLVIEP